MLLLTDKFAPHRGGTAIIYTEWCRRLGDEVSVVTCGVPGTDWRGHDAAAPYQVVRAPFVNIPKVRYPLAWAGMHARAHAHCRSVRPDVVHAGQVLETGFTGLSLKRRYGIPLVVHTYGEEIEAYRRGGLTARWLRAVLGQADAVTAISSFTRRRLAELGVPEERLHLQYPGVQAEPFLGADASEVRRRYSLADRPVLLTVARLLERKGHDVVLRALPHIVAKVPEVAYLVVGSGPREASLRQLAAELGMEQRVTFAGTVAHTETPSYFAAADVFIHPNRQLASGDVEGFGIVFLEANAAGKPVIGGNSGGTPDAVVDGETGFLVEPANTDAVAEAAIRLLTDRDLAQRLGEQGRARAVSKFTWETAVERLRAINQMVLARDPARVLS